MFETSLRIAVLCTEGNGAVLVHAFSPALRRKETSPWKKCIVVKVFIYSFFLVYLFQRVIHVTLGLLPSSDF